MKRLFLIIITIFLMTGSSTFAQTNIVPITGGRFFMERNTQSISNALIETANFTALSWLTANSGASNAVWDVCSLSSSQGFCKAGQTFNVPNVPYVEIGFCSACSPPQFPRGTFTINGITYENAHFYGQFHFSQAAFLVTPMLLAKRKGFVRLTKTFTMTGNLQVCRTFADPYCSDANTLFDGQITGHGTLTVRAKILYNEQISSRPFLARESIEYQFEQ